MKSARLIKRYLCMGKTVNLWYENSKNCYVVEYNDDIVKVFSRQTSMQIMETFAMQFLTKLTDKNQEEEKNEE